MTASALHMNETLQSLLGTPGEIDVALRQATNVGRGKHDLDLVVDVRPLRWLPVWPCHSALAQVPVPIELLPADPNEPTVTIATNAQVVIGLKAPMRSASRHGCPSRALGKAAGERAAAQITELTVAVAPWLGTMLAFS
jgi:hypothetical protein